MSRQRGGAQREEEMRGDERQKKRPMQQKSPLAVVAPASAENHPRHSNIAATIQDSIPARGMRPVTSPRGGAEE